MIELEVSSIDTCKSKWYRSMVLKRYGSQKIQILKKITGTCLAIIFTWALNSQKGLLDRNLSLRLFLF